MKHLLMLILIISSKCVIAQTYYCVQSSNGKIGLMLSVNEEKKGANANAIYKGQRLKINLKFIKEYYRMCKGCAHGTLETTYNEILNNKITGQYFVSKSANNLEVIYTRKKDNKKFIFEGYDREDRNEPCKW